jgi:hypothetical protein
MQTCVLSRSFFSPRRTVPSTCLRRLAYVLSDILTLVEGTIRDAFRPAVAWSALIAMQ